MIHHVHFTDLFTYHLSSFWLHRLHTAKTLKAGYIQRFIPLFPAMVPVSMTTRKRTWRLMERPLL